MKKALLPILILLLAGLLWGAVWFAVPSYRLPLKANWGITLPVRGWFSQVFAADSGPSFHGDGLRYHVFSCRNGAAAEKMTPWSGEAGAELWEECTLLMDELDIPTEQRPASEGCVSLLRTKADGSRLYLLWSSKENTLWVLERFI